MTEAQRKPNARTRATRSRLVATAEQLFAERGVAAVSLNEITRAAKQKNRNAVHYHFGSKEALLEAIFQKHWEPIADRRREMVTDLPDQPSIEQIASILVEPVAARFEDPDGGLAYIKISAELAASNLLNFQGQGEEADYGPLHHDLWLPHLAHLPPAVREHRMSLVVGMLFHSLADHAIFRESQSVALADTQLMVSNLVDAICAVLRAPVSESTRALIQS